MPARASEPGLDSRSRDEGIRMMDHDPSQLCTAY
jgi:hypothetical protein